MKRIADFVRVDWPPDWVATVMRGSDSVGLGDWKTASVRSHQRFSGLCSGAGCTSALTRSG